MFAFLTDFSRAVNMDKSELMRKLVEHYFLMYFSEGQKPTYEEVKFQFLGLNSTVKNIDSKDKEETNQ